MQNKDFKPSDQSFEVTVEHSHTGSSTHGFTSRGSESEIIIIASIININFIITTSSHSSAPRFQMPPGLQVQPASQILAQQPGSSASSKPQVQPQQPVQVRRRIRTKSKPQETHQRLQQCFRTSRKIIFPSLRIRSMQIIRKLNQKKSCFKVSFFSNGIKGIFRDIQQMRSRSNHKRAQANRSSRS